MLFVKRWHSLDILFAAIGSKVDNTMLSKFAYLPKRMDTSGLASPIVNLTHTGYYKGAGVAPSGHNSGRGISYYFKVLLHLKVKEFWSVFYVSGLSEFVIFITSCFSRYRAIFTCLQKSLPHKTFILFIHCTCITLKLSLVHVRTTDHLEAVCYHMLYRASSELKF